MHWCHLGGQIAQQYITIPVSLNMGAQPIQILANPPILTAANISGLQQLAMLPGLPTQEQVSDEYVIYLILEFIS